WMLDLILAEKCLVLLRVASGYDDWQRLAPVGRNRKGGEIREHLAAEPAGWAEEDEQDFAAAPPGESHGAAGERRQLEIVKDGSGRQTDRDAAFILGQD